MMAYEVNIFQLSVKYRRTVFVCRDVSDCDISNKHFSVKYPWKNSVLKSVCGVLIFFFKKLFRINNIKLYKWIVKKTNYANKIVLNIKNKKIKLNNFHPNIHYKFNVFPKKINLEQWRSWKRRTLVVTGTKRPKKGPTCITHMWSNVNDHLAELFIIRRKSLVLLLQGHELLRLGARYWLGAPNGWDTTGRPQVLGRSARELVHSIFIGSTRRSYLHPQIQIEGSFPYLSLNRLL